MRDPHVERLFFEIGAGEGTSYRNPPPLCFSNALGEFKATDGLLVVEPLDHFASKTDARTVIEPFLRSWEIETDLTAGIGTIRFRFKRAETIDRDPPASGSSRTIELEGAVLAASGLTASLHVTRAFYPAPPKQFRSSAEVEAAYRRWRNVKAAREPLQSMAYFLLTLLESGAGGRRQAAGTFSIDVEVLKAIGHLSSKKGDLMTARKVPRKPPLRELTGPERTWLDEAIKRIIVRLGERASGAPMKRLAMSDLPRI
jgi:hypothetical protein